MRLGMNGVRYVTTVYFHLFSGLMVVQAPGEAEAELAYLNMTGQIDAILSDDVDTFLFGATTVIRNPSISLPSNMANPALNCAGKKDVNWSRVFTFPHATLPGLTREGLVMFAILSGGDYQSGLDGCGPKIANGLARTGLAMRLYQIASSDTRDEVALAQWREDLKLELATNASGFLPKKCVALSRKIPDDFPPADVLAAYLNPITSKTHRAGKHSNTPLTWSKDPDLGKIAALCERSFEWGYREKLIHRFRTLLWPWIALRYIRRVSLDPGSGGCELGKLFVGVTLSRNHASTNNLLEYRVTIDPSSFVALAESGLLGIRHAPDDDDDGSDDGGDEEEKARKKSGSPPPEPGQPMLIWVPAVMVERVRLEVVDVFLEKKRAKERKKGAVRTKSTVSATTTTAASTTNTETTTTRKRLIKAHPMFDEDEASPLMVDELPPVVTKPKRKPAPTTMKDAYATVKPSVATSTKPPPRKAPVPKARNPSDTLNTYDTSHDTSGPSRDTSRPSRDTLGTSRDTLERVHSPPITQYPPPSPPSSPPKSLRSRIDDHFPSSSSSTRAPGGWRKSLSTGTMPLTSAWPLTRVIAPFPMVLEDRDINLEDVDLEPQPGPSRARSVLPSSSTPTDPFLLPVFNQSPTKVFDDLELDDHTGGGFDMDDFDLEEGGQSFLMHGGGGFSPPRMNNFFTRTTSSPARTTITTSSSDTRAFTRTTSSSSSKHGRQSSTSSVGSVGSSIQRPAAKKSRQKHGGGRHGNVQKIQYEQVGDVIEISDDSEDEGWGGAGKMQRRMIHEDVIDLT